MLRPEDRDIGPSPPGNPLARARWAVLRLALGIAQMVGAVAALLLIMAMGLNALALAAVASTSVLTTVSVLLFGSQGPRSDAARRHIRS